MGWLKTFTERRTKLREEFLKTLRDIRYPSWDELCELYPIGKEFQYLGIVMVVVSRKSYTIGEIPVCRLICEYADSSKVIHTYEFSATMFSELIRKAKEESV